MAGTVVVASYRPKPDKKEDLLMVLKNHVPILRQLGLVTDFPGQLMESSGGCIIEIYEWESEDAAKKAMEHPKAQKLMGEIKNLCNAVPLAEIEECKTTSAQFQKVQPERTNRVVHFEIQADDAERCAHFYQRLFKWEVYQWANQPYWLVNTGDESAAGINGGIMKRRHEMANVYNTVNVDNIDETLSDVSKYGGRIVVPKMPIEGVGWLAYGQDTEGNVFGMMANDQNAK